MRKEIANANNEAGRYFDAKYAEGKEAPRPEYEFLMTIFDCNYDKVREWKKEAYGGAVGMQIST